MTADASDAAMAPNEMMMATVAVVFAPLKV
jgi:hypothetical protein